MCYKNNRLGGRGTQAEYLPTRHTTMGSTDYGIIIVIGRKEFLI